MNHLYFDEIITRIDTDEEYTNAGVTLKNYIKIIPLSPPIKGIICNISPATFSVASS
ncbi:MAG: hypothetical protein WC621_02840 [Patescibacteria group bacterium]